MVSEKKKITNADRAITVQIEKRSLTVGRAAKIIDEEKEVVEKHTAIAVEITDQGTRTNGSELPCLGEPSDEPVLYRTDSPVIGRPLAQTAIDGPAGLAGTHIARAFCKAGDRGSNIGKVGPSRNLNRIGQGPADVERIGVGEEQGRRQEIARVV